MLRQNMRAIMFYTIRWMAIEHDLDAQVVVFLLIQIIVPEKKHENLIMSGLCIILVSFYTFYACTVRWIKHFMAFQSGQGTWKMLKMLVWTKSIFLSDQVLSFKQHKGADGKTRGWGEVYGYSIMAHRDPWSAGACWLYWIGHLLRALHELPWNSSRISNH